MRRAFDYPGRLMRNVVGAPERSATAANGAADYGTRRASIAARRSSGKRTGLRVP